MSKEATTARRSKSFSTAIIFITFFLSLFAFYLAMNAYLGEPPNPDYGNSLLIMSLFGFAVSTYMLFQMQRGVPRITFEPQRVDTTIACQKCGFKNVREFQRGDYILKEAEKCPKCDEQMKVTAIYREKEKSED